MKYFFVLLIGLGLTMGGVALVNDWTKSNDREEKVIQAEEKPDNIFSNGDQQDAEVVKITHPKLDFTIELPKEWQHELTNNGLIFGTKLTDYNYLDQTEVYGLIDVRSSQYDYGQGAPGPRLNQTQLTVDKIVAQTQVFEGSGDEEMGTFPKTRLQTVSFQFGNNYYYLAFNAAADNAQEWQNIDRLIKSWRLEQ